MTKDNIEFVAVEPERQLSTTGKITILTLAILFMLNLFLDSSVLRVAFISLAIFTAFMAVSDVIRAYKRSKARKAMSKMLNREWAKFQQELKEEEDEHANCTEDHCVQEDSTKLADLKGALLLALRERTKISERTGKPVRAYKKRAVKKVAKKVTKKTKKA